MTNLKTMHFNENRSFGVEIEFKGDKHEAYNQLRAQGLNVVIVGYTHEVMNSWKITTDASAEWELVSPILKGRDGLEQLRKVGAAFSACRTTFVDKTCGFHVHHDVNDYELSDFKSLFATYLKVEAVIDTFLPVSRRLNNNRFCRSLANNGTELAPQTSTKVAILEEIKNAKSLSQFGDIVGKTRYLKLNYQSYIKYGTVEFRQHSATLDAEKMYNWVLFTQHMVNLAQERHITYGYNPVYWDTMGYFSEVMRMTPKYGADNEIAECLKYYRNRAKALSKNV